MYTTLLNFTGISQPPVSVSLLTAPPTNSTSSTELSSVIQLPNVKLLDSSSTTLSTPSVASVACKPPSELSWISKLDLSLEEKRILNAPHEWLNDKIIDACQQLLREQTSDKIGGFQTTLLKNGYRFHHVEGPFVQILHVHGNHWVTVSNISCPSGCINVYDSLYNYVKRDTKLQICSFTRPSEKKITFRLVNMQKQLDSSSCGLFAMANAVELANGNDPASCTFQLSQMRRHVIECFELGVMHPFPQETAARARTRRDVAKQEFRRVYTDDVYCACRSINDSKKPMVQCGQCKEWYHYVCIKYEESSNVDFYCNACTN